MQKYLIDTQILIWSIVSPEKIELSVKNILTNNAIFVSQVSLFEIAIKQKIGKLPELSLPINRLVNLILEDDFEILTIANNHIDKYNEIPFLGHHKDPFDRLILATSLAENMPIISSDGNFKYYVPQITLISND